METASSTINGYNGCSTLTYRTPDDVFISWVDGAMTATGEIRKEAHIPIKLLAYPKTKVKVGTTWKERACGPFPTWGNMKIDDDDDMYLTLENKCCCCRLHSRNIKLPY